MQSHNIDDVGSDTELERSKDEPTCPPTNSKIGTLKEIEVSATDTPDDGITTITHSTGGSDPQVIPKNYFMTSKGHLRLKEKDNDPQWKQ